MEAPRRPCQRPGAASTWSPPRAALTVLCPSQSTSQTYRAGVEKGLSRPHPASGARPKPSGCSIPACVVRGLLPRTPLPSKDANPPEGWPPAWHSLVFAEAPVAAHVPIRLCPEVLGEMSFDPQQGLVAGGQVRYVFPVGPLHRHPQWIDLCDLCGLSRSRMPPAPLHTPAPPGPRLSCHPPSFLFLLPSWSIFLQGRGKRVIYPEDD